MTESDQGPSNENSKQWPGIAKVYPAAPAEDSELLILEKFTEKLHLCYSDSIAPGTENWPKERDYTEAWSAILFLDPLRGKRRKRKPLWRYTVASVDNFYRDLLLRERIKSFVLYALPHLSEPRDIPAPTVAFYEAVKSHQNPSPTVNDGRIKAGKRAFAIYNGREVATGDWADKILDLCPATFRRLNLKLLKEGSNIPKDQKRFVEYAAALEVVRVYRNYLKERLSWEEPLLRFLSDLGFSMEANFEKIESLLEILAIARPENRDEIRRKNRERKRKSRKRIREKRNS